MKIQSIEIEGFQSFRDRQRIEMANVNLAVATGENGVGKSTLITDAVALCFFGKVRTSTLEEAVSTDAMHAQVIIEFELGGLQYKMERTVPRVGTQEARIFIQDLTEDSGWRPITERGARENTNQMINLLGTDWETATTTWLAMQGDYGKFSKAKPAERYGILGGIFDLGRYQPLHEAAQQRLKEADKGLSNSTARIEEIELTLSQKPDLTEGEFGSVEDEGLEQRSAEEQTKADALGAQLAEIAVGDPARKRDELKGSLTRMRQNRQRLEGQASARHRGLTDQLARAEREVQTAGATLTRIATARWDSDALSRERASVAAQLDAQQGTIASFEQAAATYDATAQSLGAEWQPLLDRREVAEAKLVGLRKNDPGHTASCFTCGQHLSDDEAQRLIEEQEAEIELVEKRKVEVSSAGKKARGDAAAATAKAQAARAELRTLQGKLDGLVRQAATADALIATEADANASLAEATERVETLTAESAEAKSEWAELQLPTNEEEELEDSLREAEANAQVEAREIESRRNELRSAQAEHLGRVRIINREIDRRVEVRRHEAELTERLKGIQDARAIAAKDKRTYSVLTRAFSPAGIPAMILTGVVEEVGAEVNKALAHLSKGQLSVDIRASKETRSGGIQQKIVIYVDAPDGIRAYESLSGGQKFRVDLAIRTGLNKVISRRTGTPIETFVIDEGWGTLDEVGVLSAIDTMERLSKDLNVLTVSHIDSVKNAFPTVYEVRMEAGTSMVNTLVQ